jgi:cysteine-rich repeat protein
MLSSTRLAKKICFALLLAACSGGRQPLRSNVAPDAAATDAVPDAPVAPDAAATDAVPDATVALLPDARPDREGVHDGPVVVPDAGQATCGNGKLGPGEQCDDGNTRSGDGCSPTCQLDDPVCPFGPPCWPPMKICGNGRLDGQEQCDDGNTTPGDGCSGTCTIEPGWRCRVPGKRCLPVCGDHMQIGGESCDDGNTHDGDGCSARCETEPGWDCASGTCIEVAPFDAGIDLGGSRAVCGDGVVSALEECDCGDGTVPVPFSGACLGPNADDVYGGCTTRCLWGPFCGDGLVNGSEACDLGPLNGQVMGKDGCTLGCTRPHYCGDGIVDTSLGEQCDLGPLNGLTLDQNLNPTTDPNGMVYCRSDCSLPVPFI